MVLRESQCSTPQLSIEVHSQIYGIIVTSVWETLIHPIAKPTLQALYLENQPKPS